MNRKSVTAIQRAFGVPVVVLPVIHLQDESQGASEALLAFKTGAHGVFLIDHGANAGLVFRSLDRALDRVHAEGFKRPWFGVNLLGHTTPQAFDLLRRENALDVSGVWCDGPPRGQVGTMLRWHPLWFGGVGFKYQRSMMTIEEEGAESINAGVDVLTTSGPATGMPCDPEKVRRLRALVGPNGSVGVASGVNAANARGLVDAGADALLVASSIARTGDFHRMDAGRLAELLAAEQP